MNSPIRYFKDLTVKWGAFLRRVLAFAAVAAAVLAVPNVILHDAPAMDDMKFSELFMPRVNAELVILGDSRGEFGIDPGCFSHITERAYNFSFSGAKVGFFRDLYFKVLRRHYPKPRVIIYSVFPDIFADGRYLSQDSKRFPLDFFLEELASNSGERRMLFLNRYPVFRNWVQFLWQRRKGIGKPAAQEGPFNGFVPRGGYIQGLELLRMKRGIDPRVMKEGLCAEFEALIVALQADGIKVIFVEPPVYQHPSFDIRPKLEHFEGILKRISKDHGVPYLNYNEELKSPMNDDPLSFHDPSHLHEDAARIFSRTLRRDLEGILKPVFKDGSRPD
ncbi:MAG: hypothetical protein A3A86_04765 [Elusimicrobia bacterium RIFCSPLOWO2_01_FULL_60_11]|nr:MAG: hypothetical protein A3A86_04765 [Elusimicrobia bacterium RIFCSPLOWO2_01_FULL_60_11]